MKVPKDEGKYGFIDDFERLITGVHDGGIRKITQECAREDRSHTRANEVWITKKQIINVS